MAYLHHRLSQCPFENDLLAKARQLGRQRGRPAAHTAPHKVMPLQVCLSSCPYSLMLLAPILSAPFPPSLRVAEGPIASSWIHMQRVRCVRHFYL